MKFTAVVIAAIAAPFANAAVSYPAGFEPKCCVRDKDARRLDEGFQGLNGYDPKTYTIDDICTSDPPAGWTCYTFKEVCENGSGLFNPGVGSTKPDVCKNQAHCFNEDDEDDACDDGTDYPDIWWSCEFVEVQDKTKESFFCGYQCKFTDACGDPHFELWNKEWYDFHGECDLVMLKNPDFGMGLGLTIHIRTKARYEYSFIESAAVQIGDDILEVSSYGEYAFNGVDSADLSQVTFADMYRIEHVVKDKETSEYIIRTGGNEHLKLKSFKDLVSVKANNATSYNFGASQGMMGDFFEGKMLARDGTTIINTPNEFGLEWQVREDEPRLFKADREPQLPHRQCIMPTERIAAESRRLGSNPVNKAAAEGACAGVDKDKFENCVFDVVATGDLSTAKIYN